MLASLKIGLVLMLLTVPQPFVWVFEFEKDAIKVFTSEVEGSSFKAFKGECVMNVPADVIASKIMDVNSYSEWCYRTTSVKELDRRSDRVYYHYISETPVGVKDREGYLCSRIEKSDTSNQIKIIMNVYDPKIEIPSGFIRIPKSDGYWKLTPLTENSTAVVFEVAAEPGGIIPSWLANMAASESPYLTLLNLRKLLQKK